MTDADKAAALSFSPAEWALFEAVEVLASAAIRRGQDAATLAEAFDARAKAIITAGGDREAAFAKALVLHTLAERCLDPKVWAGQRAAPVVAEPREPGAVVAFPSRMPPDWLR
jgi:hypothetical protein